MQVAVNFQNEIIAQKVLWMLDHFKNDGVEVIPLDDNFISLDEAKQKVQKAINNISANQGLDLDSAFEKVANY